MPALTWTLADTLREYDTETQDAELTRFRDMQCCLAEVIDMAAGSRDERGISYGHQAKNWNFWPDAIPKAAETLSNSAGQFQRCGSFDEIYALVKELIFDIEGLADLYWYDVAFRIGAFLGHLPEWVYLHSGTREGARRLGLSWRGDYLEMSELPESLRERQPWEVENILCHHAKRCRRRDRLTK